MTERTYWETINEKGNELLAKLKELAHEGNVRHVVIKQAGKTVAEFPITVGVVGAVFAPTLAAVGAVVAVLTDCTWKSSEPNLSRSEARTPPQTGLWVTRYFRCFPTSLVISNMLTLDLPPKMAFSVASELIIRLFFASCLFFLM